MQKQMGNINRDGNSKKVSKGNARYHPEYELVAGWLDKRTTQKSKNGTCHGTKTGVERKNTSKAGKYKIIAFFYDKEDSL